MSFAPERGCEREVLNENFFWGDFERPKRHQESTTLMKKAAFVSQKVLVNTPGTSESMMSTMVTSWNLGGSDVTHDLSKK